MREKIKYWLFQKGKNCRRCCLRCEYYAICRNEVTQEREVKSLLKVKKPFYEEFMTKKQPTPPRNICRSKTKQFLGIISPTLYYLVASGGKGKKAAEELEKFEKEQLRYLCFKRKLSKNQWKVLHRLCKKERQKNEKL